MVPPRFQAFLDLNKYIAEKLCVSNNSYIAAKVTSAVTSAVQKEMKEKHPRMVSIAAEGRKHFDKNMEHYKQMLLKLILSTNVGVF